MALWWYCLVADFSHLWFFVFLTCRPLHAFGLILFLSIYTKTQLDTVIVNGTKSKIYEREKMLIFQHTGLQKSTFVQLRK
jgi:hypothetical protein